MKTTYINNLPIIEIDNFLSINDSKNILDKRLNHFKKAISHYPIYYRNNDRLVEDNKALSKQLLHKLYKYNMPALDKISGLNSRIRFCRYQKNQQFSKHQDGVHYPNDKHESKYTFLLYLNDQETFTGGDTEFFISKYDDTPSKVIKPQKGKLVIFDHRLWHQGATVISGNKYILRSDVYVDRSTKTKHHHGYIWHLLKLNDDHFLSCGRDTTIKLWNANIELQKTMRLHSKSVLKIMRFNQSDFISCSRDFTIKKWNLFGKVIASISLNEMILNLSVTKKGHIIAVGTSGNLYVLNSSLEILDIIKIHNGWIWDVSIKNDNTVITCCEDGTINLTNLDLKVTECLYTYNQPLLSLNTEQSDSVLIGTKNGTLIEFSMITKKANTIKVHNDIIRSIICVNNSIITCGEDNKVIVIEKKTNKTKTLIHSDNFIQDILVLKTKIYAAGYDGTIAMVAL